MEGHDRYGLQSHTYCINDGEVEARSPNPAVENATMSSDEAILTYSVLWEENNVVEIDPHFYWPLL
jgi:hypothetical protein